MDTSAPRKYADRLTYNLDFDIDPFEMKYFTRFSNVALHKTQRLACLKETERKKSFALANKPRSYNYKGLMLLIVDNISILSDTNTVSIALNYVAPKHLLMSAVM